ncbi:O-methyltransferase [Lachnellula subtilissima]|uniref:O-methyltransferase n=1 Tax=Lachnellula subtilissima TaxID=602034 RepID=A0A8H8RSQ6_9HELO|nr:O-methyltransferase [Lachnellula subtilissima]
MSQFLAATSFANPAGPLTAFQSAFTTDLQLFPLLMQHPTCNPSFSPPTRNPNSALLVDRSGGRGHDLEAFRNRFPDGKGRLVLQDLPPVIADIRELHADIVRQEYDFLTPQPVIDARAYYLRSNSHDYSDAKCRDILQHIVKAMKPGFSKLLIFE